MSVYVSPAISPSHVADPVEEPVPLMVWAPPGVTPSAGSRVNPNDHA